MSLKEVTSSPIRVWKHVSIISSISSFWIIWMPMTLINLFWLQIKWHFFYFLFFSGGFKFSCSTEQNSAVFIEIIKKLPGSFVRFSAKLYTPASSKPSLLSILFSQIHKYSRGAFANDCILFVETLIFLVNKVEHLHQQNS